jgi:hypothetical protein
MRSSQSLFLLHRLNLFLKKARLSELSAFTSFSLLPFTDLGVYAKFTWFLKTEAIVKLSKADLHIRRHPNVYDNPTSTKS